MDEIRQNTLIEYDDEKFYIVDGLIDDDDDIKIVNEMYYKPTSIDDKYTGKGYTFLNIEGMNEEWFVLKEPEELFGIDEKYIIKFK